MKNQFVWVDIPVIDLDRAIHFYSKVLGQAIHKETMENFSFGVLPHDGAETGGCLVISEDNQPSPQGPLVYLNVDGKLDQAIEAVKRNGGKILQNKQSIGEHGFRVIIVDSEGNRIALHSTKS